MKAFVLSGLCAAALWGGAARAQEDYRPSAQSVELETVQVDTRTNRADTGIYAMLGGGAEGYTGQLAPTINPGLSYGATLGYRPSPYFGVELGYSGGVSDVDFNRADGGGIANGPDLVRNGGQALLVGNMTDTKLQPYVVSGVGVETYNVRSDRRGEALGFNDDTSGYVPAGLGLRYQLGGLITADARVAYNILFDQDFAPSTLQPGVGDGRYSATLSVGGTY
ncbi:outer membrane beta-barrel protein [Pyxidicoccus sp. MSG2]|uniref:outer membrane beta-barrel protein n=1 Tax=Pyxidicoccus sp. MSG2 TaxID=2996790 RepID=UPI00226EA505|nr:outer membrane beta-barrel protein [Pyxidicoccus sp. MSG2]MCY1018592.1 outer membrane beta-barrel protein [Pyxidicoccus sp. MSG2]